MEKTSVCIIGSGNWATSIAKIVAENVVNFAHLEDRVNMYVYDEMHQGRHLSDTINTTHVNTKYAPELKLPKNLVACTDLLETAKYCDVIVFVTDYKLIPDFCRTLLGKIKPFAIAITVTKGFSPDEEGGLKLVSHSVMKHLKIPCSVLMGANLSEELNKNAYCEATLGCRDAMHNKLLQDIFRSENFRVAVVDDADCVEVIGFLKHILAFAVGILDGYDCSTNTKSACIRFGFLEMIRFVDVFYPGCKLSTFFETCGLADLITVCHGSRNRRLAEALVKSEYTLVDLQNQLLQDDRIMGPIAAASVQVMLEQKGLEDKFPLFMTVFKICEGIVQPEEMLNCIRTVPDIIYHPTNTFPL